MNAPPRASADREAAVPDRGRPRLLIVGPLPPPIGGVETFTQAILASSEFAAFDVAHCDTTKGRPKDTQGRFDLGNAGWALRHFARLQQSLNVHRPQVVYIPIAGTWSGFLRDVVLGWLARRSGARVIGHQHAGDIPQVLARRGLNQRLVRGGFAQFDRLLVLGALWKTLFERYGLTMPIDLCPSTLRREVYDAGLRVARPAAHEVPPRVLFVGQVGRRKGVIELLDAVHALRARGHALTLTIVGPAQLPGELEAAEAHARALSLTDIVTFTGPLEGDALLDRFRTHDVFALPSHNEGIPAVLYEAGAFGLAVLTTPVGGIPELIHDGDNGRLVPVGDLAALTAALESLIGDPAMCARLGNHLREAVAAYHPDRVSQRIVQAVHAELERA